MTSIFVHEMDFIKFRLNSRIVSYQHINQEECNKGSESLKIFRYSECETLFSGSGIKSPKDNLYVNLQISVVKLVEIAT